MNLHDILDLSNHGADTFVGKGPQYPWGGLYGGQIVAQALKAAALTIDPAFSVHSLRAYFIRRGDHDEPVRYEVDRIRNGRTFCKYLANAKSAEARQAIGAILNLEASFQADEVTETIQTVDFPGGTPAPGSLKPDSWTPVFDRRSIDVSVLDRNGRAGAGRAAAWMRVADPVDDPLSHACGLSYLSDDLPTDAVVRAHPLGQLPEESCDLVPPAHGRRPVAPARFLLFALRLRERFDPGPYLQPGRRACGDGCTRGVAPRQSIALDAVAGRHDRRVPYELHLCCGFARPHLGAGPSAS